MILKLMILCVVRRLMIYFLVVTQRFSLMCGTVAKIVFTSSKVYFISEEVSFPQNVKSFIRKQLST